MGLLLAGLAGAAEQGIDSINKRQAIDVQAERDAKMVESQKSLAEYNSELIQTRDRESAKLRQEMAIEEENRQNSSEHIAAKNKAQLDAYNGGVELRSKQAKDKSSAEALAEEAKLDFYKKHAPDLLKQIKDMEQAKHIEGAGSLITARLAKMGIDEKVQTKALIDAFANEQDPVKKEAKRQSLIDRQIIKPEVATSEVTTYDRDELGNAITQTKSTVKNKTSWMINQPGNNDGKQDVRVNGVVIGKATTEAEAKALVQQYKQTKEQPSVPGRSLYNAKTSDLQRIATKPRGVSSAEASAAQQELDSRKGEQRMKAY